jgi:hypothetical protein
MNMEKRIMNKKLFALLAAVCATQGSLVAMDNSCCPISGEPLNPNCTPAIYNLPAKPDLCWDVYARASFLYWSNAIIDMSWTTEIDALGDTYRRRHADFPFKPGFEVGIGIDLGPVVLDIDYIRMHYHHTSHATAANGSKLVPKSTPTGYAGVIFPVYNHASAGYTSNLDDLRITLQTPAYVSKRMILTAGYGLDIQWDKHEFNRKWSNSSIPANVGQFTGKTEYWAIGPVINGNAEALLCYGFKLIGNTGFAVDYMKYTTYESGASFPGAILFGGTPSTPFANFVQQAQQDFYSIMPMANMEIGLGWQSYLFCDQIYLDLSVTYEWYTRFYTPGFYETVLNVDANCNGLRVQGRIDF